MHLGGGLSHSNGEVFWYRTKQITHFWKAVIPETSLGLRKTEPENVREHVPKGKKS